MHEQVAAEKKVREGMAIPIDERLTRAQTVLTMKRAIAAYDAYMAALPDDALRIMRATGLPMNWEHQPHTIQDCWIAAVEAASLIV